METVTESNNQGPLAGFRFILMHGDIPPSEPICTSVSNKAEGTLFCIEIEIFPLLLQVLSMLTVLSNVNKLESY
jgi:hypothetical protein